MTNLAQDLINAGSAFEELARQAKIEAAANDLLAACEHALAFMESIPHSAGLTNIDARPLVAAIRKATI